MFVSSLLGGHVDVYALKTPSSCRLHIGELYTCVFYLKLCEGAQYH